jgi:hypothetical protein
MLRSWSPGMDGQISGSAILVMLCLERLRKSGATPVCSGFTLACQPYLDSTTHRWTPVRDRGMGYRQFTLFSIPRPWKPI